jgi:hypothetical protein
MAIRYGVKVAGATATMRRFRVNISRHSAAARVDLKRTYAPSVSALCRRGEYDKAIGVVEEWAESYIEMGQPDRVGTAVRSLDSAIYTLLRDGASENIRTAFELMSVQADLYLGARQRRQAVRVLEEMGQARENVTMETDPNIVMATTTYLKSCRLILLEPLGVI